MLDMNRKIQKHTHLKCKYNKIYKTKLLLHRGMIKQLIISI